MEDSLQREDVENMSRENMKNLHEIMQVNRPAILELTSKHPFFSLSGSVMFVSGVTFLGPSSRFFSPSVFSSFIGAGVCLTYSAILTVMSTA